MDAANNQKGIGAYFLLYNKLLQGWALLSGNTACVLCMYIQYARIYHSFHYVACFKFHAFQPRTESLSLTFTNQCAFIIFSS